MKRENRTLAVDEAHQRKELIYRTLNARSFTLHKPELFLE
jgi:hypothetical protein